MSSKTQSDEKKSIEVTLGPDRGARWLVAADIADAAIAEGWARDALAPPPEEPPEPLTPEKRDKAITAAMKAARELRGEPEEDKAGGEYETSDMTPRRGPGRPRKESSE